MLRKSLKKYVALLMAGIFVLCSGMSVYASEMSEDGISHENAENMLEAELETDTEGIQCTAAEEQEEEPETRYSSVYVGKTCIYDGTNLNNSISGVSYDVSTSTLTLENYQGTFTSSGFPSSGDFVSDFAGLGAINADGIPALTIRLMGKNVIDIKTADGRTACAINYSGAYYEDNSGGLLKITGTGSLDVNMKGDGHGSAVSIGFDDGFLMDSGTLNINADVKKGFYGIARPGVTDSLRRTSATFDILGGNINIKCRDMSKLEGGYGTLSVGIDSQDTDLTIRNAEVNITLGTAGSTFAIACGLYKEIRQSNERFVEGGTLTVENAVVRLKTGESGYGTNAYFYNFVNPGNELLYVGKNIANRLVKTEEAFSKHSWDEFNERMELDERCLVISPAEIEVHADFDDVHEGTWYYSTIDYIFKSGLMTGLDNRNFGPSESLARAQFAVIMHRKEGSPDAAYTPIFKDVVNGQWYTKPILWANDAGVVKGYTNGCFGPGDPINREQMAVIMYRYAGLNGYDTTKRANISAYVDSNKVSDYSRQAVQWCVAEGIITGKNQGTILDPQGNATRAECAAIMKRFVEKYN